MNGSFLTSGRGLSQQTLSCTCKLPPLLQKVQLQSSSCWSAVGSQVPHNWVALCHCRARLTVGSHSACPAGGGWGVLVGISPQV